MTGDESVWVGVLELAAITLAPVAVGCAVVLGSRLVRRARDVRRPTAAPEPWRRPIEEVASDLRRLAAALDAMPAGTPRARLVATTLAYDDVLREACAALGVPERLVECTRRGDAVAERERVELALALAGLRISRRRPRRAGTP